MRWGISLVLLLLLLLAWPPMRTFSVLRVCLCVWGHLLLFRLCVYVAAVHLHSRSQKQLNIFRVCGLPRALADSQFVVNNNSYNNKK